MTPEQLDATAERLLAEREARGLPRQITDPAILERVARLLGFHRPGDEPLGEPWSEEKA